MSSKALDEAKNTIANITQGLTETDKVLLMTQLATSLGIPSVLLLITTIITIVMFIVCLVFMIRKIVIDNTRKD